MKLLIIVIGMLASINVEASQLTAALRDNNWDTFISLIGKRGVNLNAADETKRTAMDWAVKNNNMSAIILLRSNGGLTTPEMALMGAAKAGKYDRVMKYLRMGVRSDVRAPNGLTAADYARLYGQKQVQRLLEFENNHWFACDGKHRPEIVNLDAFITITQAAKRTK